MLPVPNARSEAIDMMAETHARLGDGEAGLEDGEDGGDGAEDVVPAEGPVDLEPDEEPNVPGEEAPDCCGRRGDDDVGGGESEGEGRHLLLLRSV